MWDSDHVLERWRWRRSRLLPLLGAGIVGVGLGLAADHVWRPDVTALAFWRAARSDTVAVTSSPPASTSVMTSTHPLSTTLPISAGVPSALQPALTTGAALLAPHDINAMIRHLEALQGSLDAMSAQLESQPVPASSPSVESDTRALLDEMERLNQLMLPLMQQIQDAMQSGRSTSELAAMRAQMDEIHRRLTTIMDAVEASSTPGGGPSTPSAPPVTGDNIAAAPVDPSQATYALLEQALSQLQGLLRQMQSDPTFTTP